MIITANRAYLPLGFLALLSALAPAPLAPDAAGELRQIALARVEIGKKIADFYADTRLAIPGVSEGGKRPAAGMSPLGELTEAWMRRVVDAQLDAAVGKEERVAILVQEVDRTKAIEARIKALVENDRDVARIDAMKASFYRLDAEYRLAKEKLGL